MSEAGTQGGQQTPVQDPSAQQGQGQQGKPTETPAPPAKPVQEEITVALPKDVSINPKRLDRFKAWAKEQGFTSKQAQAMIDLNSEFVKEDTAEFSKAQEQAVKEYHEKNLETLKKDPVFGKDFEKNVEIARRPLAKYATPEEVKALVERGFMNEPTLARVLHKIGAAMGEDETHNSPAPPPTNDQEAQLRARFPSMYKDKASGE